MRFPAIHRGGQLKCVSFSILSLHCRKISELYNAQIAQTGTFFWRRKMGGTTNLKTALAISVFLAAMACATASGGTIYVDAYTPDNNDGSSWARAYKYLQDGLAGASSGDEIWVAAGRYKPDAISADPNGSGDRTATFTLINGVGIYGGFAPGGTWFERDPHIYETILSGDINTPGDANDNSYHVVTGSGVDPNAIIDGFTITGGNANRGTSPDDSGGGMYNDNGSPTVIGCTFSGNSARISGGGMHNEDGSTELEECTFTNNTAQSGGGMYNDSWDDPTAGNRVMLTDCIFRGNSSLVAGGGMYNMYCDSILTTCTFEDNSTVPGATGGGGICNDRSLMTLTNCTFSGNSVTNGSGGGVCNRENSDVNVVGCVFTGNLAYSYGCGMYNRGDAIVVNCTFIGNSGHLYTHSKGGGIADFYGQSLMVVNCIFTGNSAGFGGGMLNRRSDSVSVVNCTFSGNSAPS